MQALKQIGLFSHFMASKWLTSPIVGWLTATTKKSASLIIQNSTSLPLLGSGIRSFVTLCDTVAIVGDGIGNHLGAFAT